MRGYYRHTKIVATIGPATETRPRLAELIEAGVDVLRLNMAHATGEWVQSLVKQIREVSAEVKRHVAVMMDVKGPEIRTGEVSSDGEGGVLVHLFVPRFQSIEAPAVRAPYSVLRATTANRP